MHRLSLVTFTSWRVVGSCVVGSAILAMMACSAPDPPQFGGPGSLANVPPPSMNANSGQGGGGGACSTANRLPIDAACTVKWSTDIHPKMKNGGAWSCGNASCHNAGGTDPLINDDADATYEALTKKTTSGRPYFNPCSKVIGDSSFACNTRATDTCANAMPIPNGVPEGDKASINTWVACGSPKN